MRTIFGPAAAGVCCGHGFLGPAAANTAGAETIERLDGDRGEAEGNAQGPWRRDRTLNLSGTAARGIVGAPV